MNNLLIDCSINCVYTELDFIENLFLVQNAVDLMSDYRKRCRNDYITAYSLVLPFKFNFRSDMVFKCAKIKMSFVAVTSFLFRWSQIDHYESI